MWKQTLLLLQALAAAVLFPVALRMIANSSQDVAEAAGLMITHPHRHGNKLQQTLLRDRLAFENFYALCNALQRRLELMQGKAGLSSDIFDTDHHLLVPWRTPQRLQPLQMLDCIPLNLLRQLSAHRGRHRSGGRGL